MSNGNEVGWVIERYVNSQLTYWCGRRGEDFHPENHEAVRFARQEDAARVLAWLCGGNGRSAQHMWCGPVGPHMDNPALVEPKPPGPPEPPRPPAHRVA